MSTSVSPTQIRNIIRVVRFQNGEMAQQQLANVVGQIDQTIVSI